MSAYSQTNGKKRPTHLYNRTLLCFHLSHLWSKSDALFVRPLMYSLKQEMTRTLWCWWHVEARAGSQPRKIVTRSCGIHVRSLKCSLKARQKYIHQKFKTKPQVESSRKNTCSFCILFEYWCLPAKQTANKKPDISDYQKLLQYKHKIFFQELIYSRDMLKMTVVLSPETCFSPFASSLIVFLFSF